MLSITTRPNSLLYFLLPNSILCPLLSRKCMIIYLLLFLSGNFHPNPGPASLHKFINISPLDIYEPFSVSLSLLKLRIGLATLNARSVCNKYAVIYNHIVENNLDFLCLTETWINNGDILDYLLPSLLPPNYSLAQHFGRPLSMRGGSVAIIKHNSINNTPIKTEIFSFIACIS